MTPSEASHRHGGSKRITHRKKLTFLAIALMAAALLLVPGFSQETLAASVAANVRTQNLPTSNAVAAVACTSSTQCYVVNNYAMIPGTSSYTGTVTPITFAPDGTFTAGNTPLPQLPGTISGPDKVLYGTLAAIACPSTTVCYAVGSYQVTTNTGLNYNAGAIVPFTISNGTISAGEVHYIDGTVELNAIACPNTTVCYAVGSALGTTVNGVGAAAVGVVEAIYVNGDSVSPAENQEQAPGSVYLNGIACPTATNCYAAGSYPYDSGANSNGVVVPITISGDTVQLGGTQNVDGASALNGIACPNATTCYAAGYHQSSYQIDGGTLTAFSVNGSSITANFTQKIDGTDELEGISCLDASTCYAVGMVYTDSSNTSGVLAQFALLNSPSEQVIGTTNLDGIACTSGVCYAVGTSKANSSTNWMVTITPKILTGTSTSLVSSNSSPLYFQSVTFTATVAPSSGSGAPTGTVQFAIDGNTYGNPVQLTSNGGQQQASISELTLPAGNHNITATYSGDDNFASSTSTTLIQTVNPQPLFITASSPASISYGSPVPTITPSYAGFVPGESAATPGFTPPTCSTDYTVGSPAGNYTTSCSGASDSNYAISYVDGSLVVTKASQTIDFNTPSGNPSYTYGDASFTVGATATSGLTVNFASTTQSVCTVSGTTVTIVGSGTCTIVASQPGTSGFDKAQDVTRSFTIAKAVLTITADDQSVAYNQPIPDLTYSATGFVNGDTTSVLAGAPQISTTATQGSDVGTYPITISAGTLAAANYSFTFTNGTLTITPASQTITFAALPDVTYGTTPITLNASASSKLPVSYSVSGDCSQSDATLSITGAGSCSVTAKQAGNTDYQAAQSVTRTFSIAKAPLTITANDQTMPYGGTVPAFTVSYHGFVNGDTSSVVSGLTCGAVDSNGTPVSSSTHAGKYTINCSGATATNYTITYVQGTLTITKLTPTITWATPDPISYGTPLSSTQLDATASVAGTFSYTPAVGTVLDAGTGQPLKVSFTPTDTIDYTTATKQVTIAVNPAPLTISANDATMTVGGTLPSLSWSASGWVNGDGSGSLTTPPSCGTTATSASSVGTYPITCSGAVDPNYTITYQPGTLTVAYGVSVVGGEPVTVQHGFWAVVELQVVDANGNNLSDVTLIVTAENLAPAGQSWNGQNGNFVYQFQYGPAFGGNGGGQPSSGYRLMVNTRDLTPGDYTLSYTIEGDPTIHTLTITVE